MPHTKLYLNYQAGKYKPKCALKFFVVCMMAIIGMLTRMILSIYDPLRVTTCQNTTNQMRN